MIRIVPKTIKKTISESTIVNIIKRDKFFYQKSGRIYHNPNSKWAQKRVKKKKRLRIKHPIKPKEFGHIVSDTVKRVTNGVKDYFYSAIDAKLKFALTLNYKRLNSRNMKDFYKRFKEVYPLTIKSWQSDNGLENLGEFDEELKRMNIPLFHEKLADYLIFYNTKRPHKSLGLKSPIDYLIEIENVANVFNLYIFFDKIPFSL